MKNEKPAQLCISGVMPETCLFKRVYPSPSLPFTPPPPQKLLGEQ